MTLNAPHQPVNNKRIWVAYTLFEGVLANFLFKKKPVFQCFLCYSISINIQFNSIVQSLKSTFCDPMIIALLFTAKTVVNGIGSNQPCSTQMLYKFPYNNNRRINYVINPMGCVAKSYNNQVCYCKARKHKNLFPVTHTIL